MRNIHLMNIYIWTLTNRRKLNNTYLERLKPNCYLYIYIYISVVANVIFFKSNEFEWQNFQYSRARIFEEKKKKSLERIWKFGTNSWTNANFLGLIFLNIRTNPNIQKKKKTIERIRIFSRIFPDIHSFNFPESEYKNSALFADISSNIDE